MTVDYSPAERKLFEHFHQEGLLLSSSFMDLLLTTLAVRAFTDDDRTPYADALRRGLKHLENRGYRGTPEWERLISVQTATTSPNE